MENITKRAALNGTKQFRSKYCRISLISVSVKEIFLGPVKKQNKPLNMAQKQKLK